MTIQEFENKFKKDNRFTYYWNHGLCLLIIGFSLFMLFSLITDTTIIISRNKVFFYLGFIFLLFFGTYCLYLLRKNHKLIYWKNDFTKERNIELLNQTCSELLKTTIKLKDNNAYFVYKKSWWRLPYEVYLFADNNLVVINVESIDLYDGGIIDFGASKRMRDRILQMLKAKACY